MGELNGWPMMGLSFVLVVGGIALFVWGLDGEQVGIILLGVLAFVLGSIVAAGLTPVSPGQARVLQILGRYAGTIRTDGLRWVNPLAARREISTRIRNHETTVAKVNDSDGNPIEIAAVVVWQVEDTAQARFEVDDFVAFVAIQTETAVRHIANSYPYDVHDESGGMSLRDSTDEITEKLSTEIGARVQAAGVRVIESRITHLAYAPEIAQAMLRRRAGGCGRRGPAADRRGRGRHGRARPGPAVRARRGGTGRGAQGDHGQQPAGGAVR